MSVCQEEAEGWIRQGNLEMMTGRILVVCLLWRLCRCVCDCMSWSLFLSLLVVSIVKQVGNGLSHFSDGVNRKTEGTEKDNKQSKQAGVLRVTQTQIADCRRNTKGHWLRY